MKRLIKSVLATMAGISMLAVGCKGPETPVVSELTGITIKSAPAKTTYEVDAPLDLAGLVITAAYSAGDPVDIEYSDETKEKIAASGFDSTKIGNPVVTVTYTEGEASKTATFKTSVIKTVPNEDGTTTVTKVDDDGATVATTTDANGDVVKVETTVTEEDGSIVTTTTDKDGNVTKTETVVTDEDGTVTTTTKDKDGNAISVVKESKDEAGNNVKVEIVYDAEGGRTETTTVIGADGKETKTTEKYDKEGNKIVVNADGTETKVTLESIEIKKPTKLEYAIGDEKLDTKGLVVTAVYSDKSEATIDLADKNLKITGFDSSAPAEKQTITVTYNGKTATFDIKIAEAAAIEYTITYNLDGGTNSTDNPAKYTIESDKIILADPTKEGYVFDGWFTEATFKTQKTAIDKGSTGNITLYAKWSEASTGNGTSQDDLAPITKTNFTVAPEKPGNYPVYFKGSSGEIKEGDRIRYEFKIKGGKNFKQIATQGTEDNSAWVNVWKDKAGVPEDEVIAMMHTATRNIPAGEHFFSIVLDTTVDGTAPETIDVEITGLKVINYGKADEGLLYEAFGSDGEIKLGANDSGFQMILDKAFPNDYQAKAGDVLLVTAIGKSDVDMGFLQISIVDNGENTKVGESTSYGWHPLTDYAALYAPEGQDYAIKAGEEFKLEAVELPIKEDSTAAGPAYHKIQIFTKNPPTASAPTLTFSTFKIVKKAAETSD